MKLRRYVLRHHPGSDIVNILANNINSSPKSAVREAITNAFDAESQKVVVQINTKEIKIEDDGTGILDIKDFTSYGSASKKRAAIKAGKKKVAGMYHLGKLSYFKLGNSIMFLSNNGLMGHKFRMTLNALRGFPIEEADHPDTFRTKQGLTIEISNPIIDNIDRFIDSMRGYLVKTFGLKLSRGFKITFNDRSLDPNPLEYDEESELLRFGIKNDRIVTGVIKKSGSGILKVHCKDILITDLEIDSQIDCTGWVNCDDLTPIAGRDHFLEDKIYSDFRESLRRYIREHFPKRTVESTREFNNAKNYYETLMDEYVNEFSKLPLEKAGNISGGEREKRDEGDQKGTAIPVNSGKIRKPKKYQRAKLGLLHYEVTVGDDQPPIYFREPNRVYWNTKNSLLEFAVRPTDPKLGLKELRLMPFIARVLIQTRSEFKTWLYDEKIFYTDEAMRWILTKIFPKTETEKDD